MPSRPNRGRPGRGSAAARTSKTCSPRIRSSTRLVTRNAASGATVYSLTRIGAASRSCSKLSSTRRSRRPSRAIERRCSSGRSPASRTPSAYPIVGSSRSASTTFSRGTKTAPSGKRSPTAPAIAIASRLLPIPPGPRSVTSRRSGSPSSRTTAATSSSRPIRRLYGDGMREASVSMLGGSRPGLRRVEPLCQQGRQIGLDQFGELTGGASTPCRRPCHPSGCARSARRAGRHGRPTPHVDELGHRRRREPLYSSSRPDTSSPGATHPYRSAYTPTKTSLCSRYAR